jgi:hypothetical protein
MTIKSVIPLINQIIFLRWVAALFFLISSLLLIDFSW